MTVVMNLIAFLLLVALIGLIVVIVQLIRIAKSYVRLGKRVLLVLERPKNVLIGIYNTGQSSVNAAIRRFEKIAARIGVASSNVGQAASKVGVVYGASASSVDEASANFDELIVSALSASQSARFATDFADAVRRVRR